MLYEWCEISRILTDPRDLTLILDRYKYFNSRLAIALIIMSPIVSKIGNMIRSNFL